MSPQKASYVDTVNKKTGEKKNIYTLSFYDKEFTMRKNIKYKDYVVENKEKNYQ